MAGRVIYLVRSWPRLSQTFIVNEVLGLERRGVRLDIVSLVRSGEAIVQPEVRQVSATVACLDDREFRRWGARVGAHLTVLRSAPARYLRTLAFTVRHPRLAAGYGDLSALQCFHQAVVLTRRERHRAAVHAATHVHAHFAHDPALVGLLLARLLNLPFTFTGHARDLLQIPGSGLARRAAAASTVVTCCEENARYIRSVVPAQRQPPVRVIHHGVQLSRFVPGDAAVNGRVPRLVSVGRLVDKKGFADLLDSLAVLHAQGIAFRCRIYGSGPLLGALLAQRDAHGLRPHVQFMGAVSTPEIVDALQAADVFVLSPRVTADGDRDGIPNVLVEAMACAVPVVSTSAGGIPELVQHEVNGLVVASGDTAALAAALGRVLTEPQTRHRLGRAGRRTVETEYDVDAAAQAMESVLSGDRVAVEGARS